MSSCRTRLRPATSSRVTTSASTPAGPRRCRTPRAWEASRCSTAPAATRLAGLSRGRGTSSPAIPARRSAVHGVASADNLIQGNFIGTDPTGNARIANGGTGVDVNGALRTIVGGPGAARNVISGNGTGVAVRAGATGTVVSNNYVGLSANGAAVIFNATGVLVTGTTTTGNTIGGSAAGAGNVVSGNTGIGINVTSGANGEHDPGQPRRPRPGRQSRPGNTGDGIVLNGVTGNTVGGTTAGARNVISGNNNVGLRITGASATGNVDARELHRSERRGRCGGREHQRRRHHSRQRHGEHHWRDCSRGGQCHFGPHRQRHHRPDVGEREHDPGEPGWPQCGRHSGARQRH